MQNSNRGSKEHECALNELCEKYKRKGWRVIKLHDKSPDAIAAKDGKMLALEALSYTYIPKKGKRHSWTYKYKQMQYDMFDRVVIKTFELPSSKKRRERKRPDRIPELRFLLRDGC